MLKPSTCTDRRENGMKDRADINDKEGDVKPSTCTDRRVNGIQNREDTSDKEDYVNDGNFEDNDSSTNRDSAENRNSLQDI
jgi:hypothetical protein